MDDAISGKIERDYTGTYSFNISVITQIDVPERGVSGTLEDHAVGPDLYVAEE